MAITDSDKYIIGLLAEISRKRNQGKRFVYRPMETLSENVAKAVRTYFSSTGDYYIEIRKCMSCTNQYDITIEILDFAP